MVPPEPFIAPASVTLHWVRFLAAGSSNPAPGH